MIQTVLLVQTFLVMTALTILSVYAEPSIESEDSQTTHPSVIKWSKDREHINGTLSSSYLNDKQNEMTIERLLELEQSSNKAPNSPPLFKTIPQGNFILPPQTEPIWTKIQIENNDDLPREIVITYGFNRYKMDFYQTEGKSIINHQISGTRYSKEEKSLPYRHQGALFTLEPHKSYVIYVRMLTFERLWFQFQVNDYDFYLKLNIKDYSERSIFYGILIALFIFNF